MDQIAISLKLGRMVKQPPLLKASRELLGELSYLTSQSFANNSIFARLHRPAFTVTFTVQNNGSVFGGEVGVFVLSTWSRTDTMHVFQIPQVYINFPPSAGEPPSVLKGFTNIEVQPGAKQSVTINLSRHDLSIWDTVAQGWAKPAGTIRLTVGASSRDARLQGIVPV